MNVDGIVIGGGRNGHMIELSKYLISHFVLKRKSRLWCRIPLFFRLNFSFYEKQGCWEVKAKCTDDCQTERPR